MNQLAPMVVLGAGLVAAVVSDIRTRRIPAKPMSVEEAVMQIDLTNNEFFVFRNAQTNALSVIYRRKDGNYGLIDSAEAE